jgi:transcriptional regulator with XRE-family HTH domain
MPKTLTFADRLQAAIAEAKTTAYAVAKRSGLTKGGLSNLLNGSRQPNWDTVQRLAAALGLDCRAFTDPGIVTEVKAAPPAKGRGRPRADHAKVDGDRPKGPGRRK